MSRLTLFGAGLVALLIARSALAPSSSPGVAAQKLTVREEEGRVVLAWSGPIAAQMRDDIATALGRYTADPRRLVLTLNSPGGSLEQGHAVMRAIRDAARLRRIDTRIEKGAVCASMCVPIYLLGRERTADAGAHFMFHEVSLGPGSGPVGGEKASSVPPRSRKVIETLVTDAFFDTDLGVTRVNATWLRGLRTRIVDRDIWISAQALVDGQSGIVDALVPTVVR